VFIVQCGNVCNISAGKIKMVTVEELKKWLNISTDEDDLKLSELTAAAVGYIGNYCNRLFFETVDDFENAANFLSDNEEENAVVIELLPHFQQMNIKNAIIKLVCDWYEYRGNITEYGTNEVNDGIKRILQPFWIYRIK